MSFQSDGKRVALGVDDIPKRWYNILPDLPAPLAPPKKGDKEVSLAPDDLVKIFPKGLLQQEVSMDRYIDIPDEVREKYLLLTRPSYLQRAFNLERMLNTPAKIFFTRTWA